MLPYTSELILDKEVDPVILSSDNGASGLHFIQVTRTKNPGGTMTFDVLGTITDFPTQIGSWVSCYTNATGAPFGTLSDIKKYMFIGKDDGQEYDISPSRALDLMKDPNKVTKDKREQAFVKSLGETTGEFAARQVSSGAGLDSEVQRVIVTNFDQLVMGLRSEGPLSDPARRG